MIRKFRHFWVAVLLLAPVSNASAIVVYGPSGVIGDYSDFTYSISLTGLASHTSATVNFDLFIMDSWDGDNTNYGPDVFGFSVDGGAAGSSWTFNNFSPLAGETNTVAATSTGNFNTINTWGEIDRYFSDYAGGFTFAHTSSSLTLSFFDSDLQGLADESWRLDNVTVSINSEAAVPEPTTLALMGLGLAGIGAARRRKKSS